MHRGTKFAMAALAVVLSPAPALACACGCGVFEVGGGTMMPSGETASAFVRYDYLDQSENWSGTRGAPLADNDDKRITTDFVSLGGQYMFDADWGAMVEVPVWNRLFRTESDEGVQSFRHAALGDIRLMGVYSGLSNATSTTGLIFGVKLPTGDDSYPNFDWDVSIGSGSTDALLGLYHTGPLSGDGSWVWYGQAMWDKPVVNNRAYAPAGEIDGALGVFYGGFASGGVQFTPMLQVLAASRWRDGGPEGDPLNTGYTRVLLSPAVEVTVGRWSAYGDVEFPAYQDVNGNQLVAHQQFKFVLRYTLEE